MVLSVSTYLHCSWTSPRHSTESTIISSLLNLRTAMQIPHCLLIRWLHSYLSCRSQTVRVDNHYSDLLYLTAGMPHGSRLGPLTFLLLIDNLSTQCLTHKHVDDTTLTELLTRGSVGTMHTSFQQLQQWTDLNNMQINFSKTKEMILGPLAKLSPQPLLQFWKSICTVERSGTLNSLASPSPLTSTDKNTLTQ